MYVTVSRAVQAGEVLQGDSTDMVAWPESVPIEGAIAQASAVVGREALFPLAKGQPILDSELSAAGAGVGLANKIPNGMRAVALRSDEVVGVAGFLLPGSHLDVLVTYHSGASSDAETAIVLQDAVVLAAGHKVEPDPKDKTADATVVTLLLTPEQAVRAVLASTQGAIHFVLRNGGDSSRSGESPLDLSQLTGHSLNHAAPVEQAAVAPHPVVPVAVAPKSHEIETVLGGAGAGQ
jgi:pilus assembly protein CpaB